MRVSAFVSLSLFVLSSSILSTGCSSPGGGNGAGVAAADVVLTADATTDYGSVSVGSSLDKTFTVLNQGAGDATLDTIATAGLGLSGPFVLDGGTCQTGTVLSGGQKQTCTLIVKFAPTTLAKVYTDLVVQYTDATQSTSQSNPTQWELVGTGTQQVVPAAHVSISSTVSANFGSVAIGNTAKVSFTVLNDGAGDATLSTISSTGVGLSSPFSLSGGTCATGQVLKGGQSQTCTLQVTFTPTAVTASTMGLAVQFTDATESALQSSANTVTLQGAGILDCVNFPNVNLCPQPTPTLTLSDGPTFDYGSVAIANTEDHTFTVTNTGAGAGTLGTITEAALGLAAPYSLLTGGTCASGANIVPKNGSCTIIVRFTPTALVVSPLTLSVAYSSTAGGAQTATRAITGTGILDCYDYQAPQCPPPAPVVAVVGGTTFNFGSVAIGNTSTQTLTVKNSGNANGTLGDMTASGLGVAAPFTFGNGGTCATGSVLTAKGGSCTVVLTFTPAAVSSASDLLTLSYSGPATTGATANVTLSAAGVLDCFNYYQPGMGCPLPAPNFGFSDEPGFDFGSVAIGNYQQHTFTVTNAGNLAGTVGDVSDTGLGLSAPFSVVAGGSCTSGATVAAKGGSCTLIIQYAPLQQTVSAQTVSIPFSGGPSAQTATVGVSGTGILDCYNYFQPQCPPPTPLFVFSATSSNFGNVNIDTTANVTVTIYNQGHGDGVLGNMSTSGLGLSGAFTFAGGSCVSGATVPARTGSCTLTFQVEPSAQGSTQATATLNYNGPSGAMTPITLGLYAAGVLNCSVPALQPAYGQGVSDAQGINSAQAAQGTSDGEAASNTTGYNNGYAAAYQTDYNADYNQAYNTAYTSAYNAAYNSGSVSGCTDAQNVGTSDGTSVGDSDGKTDGYNAGYADGHSTGYTDGYDAGYSDGQNACPSSSGGSSGSAGAVQKRPSALTMRIMTSYSDPNQESCYQQGYGATLNSNAYQNAFNAASTSGASYNAGYSDGESVASTAAANAGDPAGTTAGQAKGKSDGSGPGYTAGYNSCYQNAYNAAYNKQYTASYNSYYASGSSDGYNDGYAAGDSDGYDVGRSDCPSSDVMVRAQSTPNAGLPRALSRDSYGQNLKTVIKLPNGIKVDLYVSQPIGHGVKTKPAIRIDARQRIEEMLRPVLRYQARKLQLKN